MTRSLSSYKNNCIVFCKKNFDQKKKKKKKRRKKSLYYADIIIEMWCCCMCIQRIISRFSSTTCTSIIFSSPRSIDRSIDRSVVGGSIGVAILFVFFRGRVGIVVGGIVVFFFLARVRFAQTHSRRFGFLFLLFFVPAAIFS